MNLLCQTNRRPGRAFTLVELLVVIAIIGILLGMSIPAMQNMRELSRRSNCEQNLVQLSLAISAYAMRNGHYPAGTIAESGPIQNEPTGYHHNWVSAILPMLDHQTVYDAIDRSVSVYDPKNEDVRGLRIPALLCPSAADIRAYTTCYAGIHDSSETPIDANNDGVLFLNRPVSDRDITDGLGYTLFVAEKLSGFEEDLGWISGTRSSLRNTGHPINAERTRIRGVQDASKQVTATYVGGIASDHPAGAYLLLGSGEYQFRSESMDLRLLRQLAARADGEIPIDMATGDPLNDGKGAAPPAASEDSADSDNPNGSDDSDDSGSDAPDSDAGQDSAT